MPRFTADRDERIIDFLRRRLPDWKTATIKQRLRDGLVKCAGNPISSGAAMLRTGDEIEVSARSGPRRGTVLPPSLGEPPLPVLYADDHLLAVDKPSGLLTVASERERSLTAIKLMRDWLAGTNRDAARRLHAAHRLDRDASGVLLLARSLDVKRQLAASWHNFQKTYLAVTDGVPEEAEGSIDVGLWEDKALFVRPAERGRGETALTHYRVLQSDGGRSLMEVRLGTGRKHQIRVHLAYIGCPIVGDVRYGVSKASRLALHAHRLELFHPSDGTTVSIVAKVPPLFRRMLCRG